MTYGPERTTGEPREPARRTGPRGPACATAALGLACLIAVGCAAREISPATGPWHAWLDSPGGELPFGLELERDGATWHGWLINGPERSPVSSVRVGSGRIELRIEPYDASLTATVLDGGTRLAGSWARTSGPDRQARLPFHATAGTRPRFPAEPGAASALAGRWSVRFSSDEHPAAALFEPADDGTVTGTFLTATGDYRYLAGAVEGERLRLSVFDGSHAFLFDARLAESGTLAGDFWSRDTWHETWTATRDSDAELPDGFALTRWIGERGLEQAVFPDLTGRPRSLADPEFAGRARILEIFGSWCPNCNDATRFLVDLDRRYRNRGLSILGLAFEMTGDFERDAAQLRQYARHHGIRYPLLIAGTADKAAASEAFPWIDRVRAFPTTIFIDGAGRIRAVHSGYSGPAAGEAHRRLIERFEGLVVTMLEGSASAG